MAMITLFCVIHGESSPFPVKLPRSDTVGDLKKLIKAEKAPEFNNFPADKLTLWKINIPENEVNTIQQLVLKDDNANGIEMMWPMYQGHGIGLGHVCMGGGNR